MNLKTKKKEEIIEFMNTNNQEKNENNKKVENFQLNQNKFDRFINNFIDQYYKGKLNGK